MLLLYLQMLLLKLLLLQMCGQMGLQMTVLLQLFQLLLAQLLYMYCLHKSWVDLLCQLLLLHFWLWLLRLVFLLFTLHPALTDMLLQVSLEVCSPGESLAAQSAGVGLGPAVHLEVQQQVGVPAEYLATHVALERLLTRVHSQMDV